MLDAGVNGELGVELELPHHDEIDTLLAGLAHLVELRGHAPLTSAPILLPEPEYFPDHTPPGAKGAAVLLRRLLAYCGLGELGVAVHVYPNAGGDVDLRGATHYRPDAAAWYAGIEDGVCNFGVAERELRHVDTLIGTLGHEVAHAYRDYHGLVASDRHVEELLTDLTTVYLGFGVFLLNSSHVFRTGGYDESGQLLLYETRTLGYLSPARLAVLLGAQAVVRALDKQERAAIVGALSANQAALFKKAVNYLAEDPDALRIKLNVPPPESWTPSAPLTELTKPLPPAKIVTYDEAKAIREQAAQEPAIAFRVQRDQRSIWLYGCIGGLLLGGAAGADLGTAGYWALVAVTTVAGYVVGMQLKSHYCSACRVTVARGAKRCECGVKLVGSVQKEVERFDAEERYWAERRRTRPGKKRRRQ